MIVVLKTSGGTFNLIGTDGEDFVLTGNLTADQLRELVAAAERALAAADGEGD